MHITITGKTGSGKTTISKLISDQMGYERYSTGEYLREIAKQMGVNMVEMNQITSDNLSYDRLIDSTVERISRERAGDKIIFDSRMAWHFAGDTFRIFITIDPDIAGRRVFNDPRAEEPYKSAEEATQQLKLRSNAENMRFRNIYGVDNFDYANFDLIIDSTYAELSDYIPIIKDSLAAYTADRENYRRRIYISPKAVYPVGRCCTEECDEGEIVLIPYKDKHYVVCGHASVVRALEEGKKYIIADIPRI